MSASPMPFDPSHPPQSRMALGQHGRFDVSPTGLIVTHQNVQETRMVIGLVTFVTLKKA
jgi:hypothetical protein